MYKNWRNLSSHLLGRNLTLLLIWPVEPGTLHFTFDRWNTWRRSWRFGRWNTWGRSWRFGRSNTWRRSSSRFGRRNTWGRRWSFGLWNTAKLSSLAVLFSSKTVWICVIFVRPQNLGFVGNLVCSRTSSMTFSTTSHSKASRVPVQAVKYTWLDLSQIFGSNYLHNLGKVFLESVFLLSRLVRHTTALLQGFYDFLSLWTYSRGLMMSWVSSTRIKVLFFECLPLQAIFFHMKTSHRFENHFIFVCFFDADESNAPYNDVSAPYIFFGELKSGLWGKRPKSLLSSSVLRVDHVESNRFEKIHHLLLNSERVLAGDQKLFNVQFY